MTGRQISYNLDTDEIIELVPFDPPKKIIFKAVIPEGCKIRMVSSEDITDP